MRISACGWTVGNYLSNGVAYQLTLLIIFKVAAVFVACKRRKVRFLVWERLSLSPGRHNLVDLGYL